MSSQPAPNWQQAKPPRGAFHRCAVMVIRYYAALRISAAAATALLPVDLRLDRPPIVRQSHNTPPGEFDRRELIQRRGQTFVITVDSRSDPHRVNSAIFLN